MIPDNRLHVPRRTAHGGDNECTLDCVTAFDSNSTAVGCQFGAGPYGHYHGMHCGPCPPERAGVWCDKEVELCSDKVTSCLTDTSTCQSVGDNQYRCVRKPQQYEVCSPQAPVIEYAGGMAVPFVCTHGGTCRDVVVGGLAYSTCDCPPGYAGDHCEIYVDGDPDTYVIKLQGDGTAYYFGRTDDVDNVKPRPVPVESENLPVGMIVYVLLFVLMLISCIWGLWRWKQLRRRRSKVDRTDGVMIKKSPVAKSKTLEIDTSLNRYHDHGESFDDEPSPDSVIRFEDYHAGDASFSEDYSERTHSNHQADEVLSNDLFLDIDII